MEHNRNLILLGCVCTGLLSAPLAQANQIPSDTVSMELTGVTGPSLGGVYTSPYTALIGPGGLTSASQFTSTNSTSTTIICDDFLTDVSIGHLWQATVTNMSALSGLTSPLDTLKFDTTGTAEQQEDAYMAAAWLAEDLVTVNQSTSAGQLEAGELSYAIWGIFDPGTSGALSNLSGADLAAADTDITDAFNAVAGDNPDQFSNVDIYTPDPQDASQEYLVVTEPVPEPAMLSLMGLGLAAVGLVSRRRRKGA